MSSDDIRESRTVVRTYSWDVEERLPPGNNAHFLGHVLTQEARRDDDIQSITAPWRKFFEAEEAADEDKNPITELIAVESVKLQAKWVVFQKNNPEEDRLDLQKFEPTVESLVDMVTDITNKWRSRPAKGWRGNVSRLFLKFSHTLNSHKEFLQMLPQGNQYVSIFTGSLNAILKACANYEKIAEGLSEALCAISERIVQCQVERSLFKTPAMLELIADLYAHIFLFLTSIMDWLMEKRYKRMLDSFNESFSKRFEDEINIIKRKAELITNLAAQSSRAEIRVTRLTIEDMQRDMRIGLQADARHQAELRYWAQRIEKEMAEARKEREQITEAWKQLAHATKMMLQEGAMGWLNMSRGALPKIPTPVFDGAQPAFYDSQSPLVLSQRSVEDISVNSRGLEDFFNRTRVRVECDPFTPVMVNPETVSRLSEWSEVGGPSSVLWLEGPQMEAEDFENPLTVMATKFVDLADRSRIPVISYFCQLSRRQPGPQGGTRETQAMTALLYALLRQMVELLLPEFETTVDLSEKRFRQLDGSLDTWEDALSVLHSLQELIPEGVLCVVDGLQWLDDRSTDKYLTKLLRELRAGKLKLLLTTTGRSACLRQEISTSDTVEVEILQPKGLAEVIDMPGLLSS